MKRVVFGFLGTVLDRGGSGAKRWDKWRPTVNICRHDDFTIDRYELLHQPKDLPLATRVIDDIAAVSPATKVQRTELELIDAWDFELVFAALHDVARSYKFDLEREQYFVHIATGTHVAQICLFLLTESRHFPGRLLQTSPPEKGHRGEPGRYRTIDLDLSRYDKLAKRFEAELSESLTFLKSGIATRNDAFNKLIQQIEHVAIRSTEPLLLMGPTGAGKSKLARKIFELREMKRKISGAFVEVNCATLRGDAAMSSLFGHIKGAYTGATRDRPGLLRAADGGILFLDEIGELGPDEQAMLLRAIEEGTFLPVGSDRETSSSFQLICGTNRDVASDVAAGRFREDLLARINLWSFRLPGLRQRPEDMEPNLDYELGQWTRRHGSRVTLNAEARARFLRFAQSPAATWAGNFRDFNAAIVRMATLAEGGRITASDVADEIARLRDAWSRGRSIDANHPRVRATLGDAAVAELDLFDIAQLEAVLTVCADATTLSAAGRILFAASRQRKSKSNDADRLRKYLARFDLTFAHLPGNLAQHQ